jgi:glutamate/tyrosine decarboxylase-like PLP-dependent enzyme
MTLETKSLDLLKEALEVLDKSFSDLPAFQGVADLDRIRPILLEVAEKMQDNFPYPHPFYLGQMLQPPHPVARLAYMLSMWVNPNNHALDGGRASSALEREAVAEIAAMFGWPTHLGHLCGGGTVANLEALWIAHRLNPGSVTLANAQAHYTHERLCGELLQIPFRKVEPDAEGRMSLVALERELETGQVGTVVVTMGTSSEGQVDPLPGILKLREKYPFRIHADAAYGGYYALGGNLAPEVKAAFDHLSEVDSLVIDPHKRGLQPYGCGCVLFKDPSVGRFYRHDSPYTYFSSHEHHLGEITLECSRPGSSAVALWATQKMMPLQPGGELANILDITREAALDLHGRIQQSPYFQSLFVPDLDLVVWAPQAGQASDVSRLSQEVFDRCAQRGLHLALTRCRRLMVEPHWPELDWSAESSILCLRSCLMKPEHKDWMDQIWAVLQSVAQEFVGLPSGQGV